MKVSLEEALAESSRRLGAALAAPGSSPSSEPAGMSWSCDWPTPSSASPRITPGHPGVRNVEGLPHEEVARRMGRGVGAVRMLWVRALSRLRQELDLPPGAES